mmetsp:Transcript_45318/g.58073  ORF Transcript_45318/g.58073 Transcript_45318/m.58073 type:complete len:233 (+) Transcript_45318:427-1125(+)
MEKCAIPKQVFLDPWRENYSLFREDQRQTLKGKPKVTPENRRSDIPAAVQWLRYDENPAVSKEDVEVVDESPAPAGGSHPYLGNLALNNNQGKAGRRSRFYHKLTAGFSEEEKRQFLLTNERHRRYSHIKQAPTDTLGVGAPLPLTNYKGGYLPTGPNYKSGAPNPWPKLAVDPPSMDQRSRETRSGKEHAHSFDPWNTTRWGQSNEAGGPTEETSALGTTNRYQPEAFHLD